MDAATIEREALALTIAERALLADRLLQTLDKVDPKRMEQWGKVADQRLDAFEQGELRDVDGPSAVASIRARLK